jgi:hypothetical protein
MQCRLSSKRFSGRQLHLKAHRNRVYHSLSEVLSRAFVKGFEQNKSLKSLEWESCRPGPDLGEVFFELSNHQAKDSKAERKLTRLSSQHCGHMLACQQND